MKHSISSKNFDNGLRLCTINTPDSHMVDLRIYFKAGFQYFDKDTFHVPHLLEHLILGSGGQLKSEEAMLRALQTMGAQCNASTDFEHITVTLKVPATNFIKALKILLNSVFDAQLIEETFDKEQEIVLREIYEQYDGLGNQQVCTLLSQYFPSLVPDKWEDHIEQTQAIDLPTVQGAYERFVSSYDTQAIVAGAFTPTMELEMAECFKALEAKIANTAEDANVAISSAQASQPKIVGVPLDLEDNANLVFTFVSRIPDDETHAQRVAYNFAAQLLFNAPTAIIPLKLRELGYVYSVTTDTIKMTDWFIVVVNVSTAADKAHLAALEIFKYLHLYGAGFIDDEEIESVRQYALNILPAATETVSDLNDWYASDVLRDRPLTSIADEEACVETLTSLDVTKAVRGLFADVHVSGMISCADAAYWVDDLSQVAMTAPSKESRRAINERFTASKDLIQKKRQAAPQRVGWLWAAYWLFMFVSWISALQVSYLPVKGQQGTISLADFALDMNVAWGVCFFAPFLVAAICTWIRGENTNRAEQLAIILNFAAAIVYMYGVYRYFGDFGVDNQPWYEDIASIVQPLFFYLMAPIAFVLVVAQQVRFWRAKRMT